MPRQWKRENSFLLASIRNFFAGSKATTNREGCKGDSAPEIKSTPPKIHFLASDFGWSFRPEKENNSTIGPSPMVALQVDCCMNTSERNKMPKPIQQNVTEKISEITTNNKVTLITDASKFTEPTYQAKGHEPNKARTFTITTNKTKGNMKTNAMAPKPSGGIYKKIDTQNK